MATLYLVGRCKDLIKSGGESIHPQEIEDHLLRHPAVAECAVIGADDPRLGEAVQAFVVPRLGYDLDAGELLRFCQRGLKPIKWPARVVICQALPKLPSGKVDKSTLRVQTWTTPKGCESGTGRCCVGWPRRRPYSHCRVCGAAPQRARLEGARRNSQDDSSPDMGEESSLSED